MECPVCGNEAKDITAADFDGDSISCPIDGDYDVAGGYRTKLEALDKAERQRVLSKAIRFAAFGVRPCISGTSF